jgi:hypothetical protein
LKGDPNTKPQNQDKHRPADDWLKSHFALVSSQVWTLALLLTGGLLLLG